MSIIIRLQNLPWAADSSDIRRYFSGLSIPEGGVHIVGGEMGDAFIAFSTDEDARLAMAKDGGKIQEMQIKLLLSSRQEMARVIERARHQNLVMQTTQVMPPLQPPPFPIMQQPIQIPTPVENERRRARSPTPPRRHSRDRSDRRRSPDSRDRGRFSSSKRERSRSPQRSSRSTNRDMDTRDRRSDRFKREDRRYPDSDSSRYSDSRYSERERYSDADHVNSRSQLFPAEAYQDNHNQSSYSHPHTSNVQSSNNYSMPSSIPSNNNYLVPGGDPNSNNNYLMSGSGPNNNNYPVSSSSSIQSNYPYNYPSTTSAPKEYPMPPFAANSNSYSYSNTMSTASNEYAAPTVSSSDNNYLYSNLASSISNKTRSPTPPSSVPFYNNSTDDRNSLRNPSAVFNLEKSNTPGMLNQMNSSNNSYTQKQVYNASSFEKPISMEKTDTLSTNVKPPQERRRKSRFEPEVPASQPFLPMPMSDVLQKLGMEFKTQSAKEVPSSEVKKPPPAQNFPPVTRSNWPHQNEQQKEETWQNKTKISPEVLKAPETKSSSQPIPMDLDPPPSVPDRIAFNDQNENLTQKNFNPVSRNVPLRNDTEKDVPVSNDTSFDGNKRRDLSTSTAEVKGIPFDTRQEDIMRLFRNIPLSPANICIQINNQRAEKAFIKFGSIPQLEKALNSQPIFIKKSQCELIPCPVAAFEAAVASSQVTKPRPKIKPREEDLTVQLKGLPFQCSENDIAHFFFGLHILDIYIEKTPDGRCSGTCFVQFATMKDFKNALTMNGKTLCHRYITISVSSKEYREFCKSESGQAEIAPSRPRGPPPRPRGPPSPPVNKQFNSPRPVKHPRADRIDDNDLPPRPPPPPKLVRGNYCIAIRGLPKGIDNIEIGEFFKEMDVSARGIHAMLDANNMPNGEAYIEVATQREVDIAISRNGKPFHGHRINMMPIPIKELDEILGREVIPPNPPVRPLLRTPESERPPRRPLLAQAPNNGQFPEHPPVDFPPDEPMRPPGMLRGPRPHMDRHMRPRMERPPRSGPPFGRMRGPRPDAPGGYPPRGYPQPPPGCVVSINNLHFNAGLEELLDFFSDFRVTRDHIIRRFIDKKPTGEARVSFESPREAQRAIRELNMKPIRGRSLHLSIL